MLTFVSFLLFLSFPLGLIVFFSERFMGSLIFTPVGLMPIFFGGIPQLININIFSVSVFAFFWLIYLLFFLSLSKNPSSFYMSLKLIRSPEDDRFLDNNLLFISYCFSLLTTFLFFLNYLQRNIGIPIGELPETNIVTDYVLLTIAPIVEEIGFRVTIIGLLAVIFLSKEKDLRIVFKSLWRPSDVIDVNLYKSLLRLLIIFSSLLFGWSHYAYGSGWDLGKISIATFAGLVLGFIYVYRGVIPAIMLHWAFNYYNGTLYYFEKLFNYASFVWIPDGIVFVCGFISLIIFIYTSIYSRLTDYRNQ